MSRFRVKNRWIIPSAGTILLIATACGGQFDSAQTTGLPPEVSMETTIRPVTTDSSESDRLRCQKAAVEEAVVDYVDDAANQTAVPPGIADQLFKVFNDCRVVYSQLISNGQREAAQTFGILATVANEYSECLMKRDYRCGMLRLQYIKSVNNLGRCEPKGHFLEHTIAECRSAVLQN